ncbi:transcriptional regulator with XRE-family HTH domain [Kibdelosporangium banguiense]|uniref:Transcriptional regulator with XRE-family HTH domain n=1 Tax=Kibdelosporangium banguiense TaxID=1365924 RepID=A0ABS4TM60_9PSEU|nr:XRE family transcriptional regulator [Kibdelosporangium banguiense]MBP2325504.1 transcriptional regulator with XRE-family HTH domain [Kibdelosporangium banguiense]
MDLASTLADVGPRLKRVRSERGVTLADLSEITGISKSTLSRLESGQRKPSLELLLPIAQAHQVPLDELVGAPEVGDPRVRIAPRQFKQRDGRTITVLPLTRHPGTLQAFKMIIPGTRCEPEQMTHEGFEWLYVLSGRLRMLLADKDVVLSVGEAAEFDTRLPHWFGSADGRPVEILSLFGKQGERMHLRARSKQ